MEVLSEKQFIVIEIAYARSTEAKLAVFEYLDERFGLYNYGIRRSGPDLNLAPNTNRMVAEIEVCGQDQARQ